MFDRRLFLSITLICAAGISAADKVGATQVAKWKDDRKAAFILMFDDSMPSHVKNVVPELKGRGMIGTFYVNPGSGHWQAMKDKWEKELPSLGMVYGNHTFTHKGAKDIPNAEEEFGKCNDAIMAIFPKLKKPTLISFGRPGVKPEDWKITDAQLKELLAKHNLIMRPNVNGRFGAIHLKTAEEMLAIVDKTIASGGADCVAFHGVGGEWLSVTLPLFVTFINGLNEKKEQLWITDHISIHKYETERASAEAHVTAANDKQIQVKLVCKADSQLYDEPLTLMTQTPASWKKVQVVQGTSKTTAAVANGVVKYDVLPNSEVITLSSAE
jgi:hypothetical protein